MARLLAILLMLFLTVAAGPAAAQPQASVHKRPPHAQKHHTRPVKKPIKKPTKPVVSPNDQTALRAYLECVLPDRHLLNIVKANLGNDINALPATPNQAWSVAAAAVGKELAVIDSVQTSMSGACTTLTPAALVSAQQSYLTAIADYRTLIADLQQRLATDDTVGLGQWSSEANAEQGQAAPLLSAWQSAVTREGARVGLKIVFGS